jgi:DNA-binding NtrC family response regulator
VSEAYPAAGPAEGAHGTELCRFGELVTRSPAMLQLFALLQRAAGTGERVLLEGEHGTGKRTLATALHQLSRPTEPFVLIDCQSLAPADLGQLLPAADRKTVYLHAVDRLRAETQAALAALLHSGEWRGANAQDGESARLVSSATCYLQDEVTRGRFRGDLLSGIRDLYAVVPALRDRREDIPLLVGQFLTRRTSPDASALRCEPASMDLLVNHDWPGNVTELQNVLERAARTARAQGAPELGLAHLPAAVLAFACKLVSERFDPTHSYRDTRSVFEERFERRYVSWLLSRHQGNLSAAAREARMDRKHLYDLARKHGLRSRSSDPS